MITDSPPAGLVLSSGEWEIVKSALARYLRGREVWAFGSRVTGKVKPFSDLDLALLGNDAIPLGVMADLADELRESDLPYKVDLIEWATTGPEFRKIIRDKFVVIQSVEQ